MSNPAAPFRHILIATSALLSLVSVLGAQKTGENATRSTLSGVYTDAQARAGEQTFANICLGCHNRGSQTGPAFAVRWRDHLVFELYETIKEAMPPDAAGSLTPGQTAELVAYLLKINGMPAGMKDLSTEPPALRDIRIEIPEKK